jgi:hypothetical protein
MPDQAVQAALAAAIAADSGAEPEFDLFRAPASEAGLRKSARLVPLRGRPPGARNKRTERSLRHVDELMREHGDPLAKALWIVDQHPADLAVLWHCSVYEAAQEQRLYLLGALPYAKAKITPEVVDNRQIIHLHLGRLGGAAAGVEGGAGGERVHVLDPEEYQRVGDDEPSEL